MHEATTYQDQPITGGPIALQVHELKNSQPVMVTLRMALGMVAFGVSIVALGFALVFGKVSPGRAKAASQRAEAALSTGIQTNSNAAVIITDESVAALATERDTNAQIEMQTPALNTVVRQATTRSARPLVTSFPQAIETSEPNRKRRGAFYEEIPSGTPSKRP